MYILGIHVHAHVLCKCLKASAVILDLVQWWICQLLHVHVHIHINNHVNLQVTHV